ncbi:MAG: DUF350 domain-containing protein [Polyangiaceae bacterium]|nr:DUF350 domain-containing protein [Polyangiaceae bacterium]
MELSTGYVAAFGGVTILAMLIAHRILRRILSPSATPRAELLGDNRAHALRETGDVLAVFLVGAAVVKNCVHGESLSTDAIWCAAFASLGLLLLEVTGHLGLLLLFSRSLKASLDRGNVAAGAAAGAHYVATGLLTSRAVAGSDLRGIGLSLVFFALAQVVHQLLVAAFRMLTTYDDAEQIEGENLAAAISYAGVSLAVATIVARALEGDFVDWPHAIAGFGLLSATAFGLYPVRQLLVQSLVLGGRPSIRGGDLDVAIARDRNVGVAALEATSYIGTAAAVAMLA